ncbi:hypothetical protein P153DRAFT_51683 [Dothidotthia symphoricarpi CBS 119687]|uniref:Uncharacterized protein n=1 Tax=Dothidotthia symphoricarpi CBS 119687 TaxID=1392245 RepID=A0A6A6A6W4_9PLEO|nr:uncharacterized protein P153DRAFT_51683 [Dothidotthia symphoricarpi CBS 119687]KAF2127560.1 hypothetical protein P153DRAFT_51683 [Dothidotthia symphoricarpi CBS 119687]
MAPLPRNNAFGAGSPSWNLSFPSGNMTAAEILAYLPHWLKSVDIIDRFVTNGGASRTIAAMINEFRHQPTGPDAVFLPNSAQIMMSYAMRRAGYDEWTVGTHGNWDRESENDPEDLSVTNFRPQRLTHPKKVSNKNPKDILRNKEADPIPFKDLAHHVKQHPSGPDALDLTRCVRYALAYPHEQLFFPTDFERLVNELGGPQTPTHSHLDRQVFARRSDCQFPSPVKSTTRKLNRTSQGKKTPLSKVMSLARGGTTADPATPGTVTPSKHALDVADQTQNGNKRRSGRLVGKVFNMREGSDDPDATDKDNWDSPYSTHASSIKKRKVSRVPPTPGSPANDSDFVLHEASESEDEVAEAEAVMDDVANSPIPARGRIAARKARQKIHTLATTPRVPTPVNPKSHFKTATEPSAEMMHEARQFAYRQPIFLKPPILSENRLKVDASSIWLYAADGCTTFEELWASALSSTRFGGPRRHAPFRELHRLTDPHPHDVSDWAENIRWAKEQYKCFGSVTWTEYDYHLECIKEHRRAVMWVSENVIRFGM